MTVLLKYLDRAFSIYGCHLFYNSLIFNPILLPVGRGSFLCLVHLHSNFQLILFAICVILVETLDFLIVQNRLYNFTKVGLSFISLLSLTRLISNY